jgi:hypothetical protein
LVKWQKSRKIGAAAEDSNSDGRPLERDGTDFAKPKAAKE